MLRKGRKKRLRSEPDTRHWRSWNFEPRPRFRLRISKRDSWFRSIQSAKIWLNNGRKWKKVASSSTVHENKGESAEFCSEDAKIRQKCVKNVKIACRFWKKCWRGSRWIEENRLREKIANVWKNRVLSQILKKCSKLSLQTQKTFGISPHKIRWNSNSTTSGWRSLRHGMTCPTARNSLVRREHVGHFANFSHSLRTACRSPTAGEYHCKWTSDCSAFSDSPASRSDRVAISYKRHNIPNSWHRRWNLQNLGQKDWPLEWHTFHPRPRGAKPCERTASEKPCDTAPVGWWITTSVVHRNFIPS